MKTPSTAKKQTISPEIMDYITEHGHCPSCYRDARAYTFTLNATLIKILQNIYGAIVLKGQNDIHLDKDTEGTPFELKYSQRSNVTILRFHGLVAKVRDETGKQTAGHWLITRRGASFLKGNISVPAQVRTFDNEVKWHSPDFVSFRDVMKMAPQNLPIVDFIDYEIANETELTKRAEQATMFDLPAAIPKQKDHRSRSGAH